MARSGMANLITRLRGMTNAGTADYTVAGSAYWTDDQLQERLDTIAIDYNRVPLRVDSEYNAGTTVYHDYYAPTGNLEEATSGTVYWRVEDASGTTVGTADYSADYVRGKIRFNSDTGGSAYYIRARSYNLNRAAALVWGEKAASIWSAYDIRLNDQTLSRSQMAENALRMQAHYDRQSGGRSTRVIRGDLA